MPTNANTYNSRVTSEALEKKFRDTFPAQGGSELVNDLFASGTIVPVVDFTSTAQGSELETTLQRAWDFSSQTSAAVSNGFSAIITNPGFWRVQFSITRLLSTLGPETTIRINDGAATAIIFRSTENIGGAANAEFTTTNELVVFLRSGDSLEIGTANNESQIIAQWRQIADVNGNLVNPLGFVFQ